MRTIETKMLEAVYNRADWQLDNTRVHAVIGAMEVQLHGNSIAHVDEYKVHVNKATFAKWPTATTASRLRALGVDARIKQGQPTINGVAL